MATPRIAYVCYTIKEIYTCVYFRHRATRIESQIRWQLAGLVCHGICCRAPHHSTALCTRNYAVARTLPFGLIPPSRSQNICRRSNNMVNYIKICPGWGRGCWRTKGRDSDIVIVLIVRGLSMGLVKWLAAGTVTLSTYSHSYSHNTNISSSNSSKEQATTRKILLS